MFTVDTQTAHHPLRNESNGSLAIQLRPLIKWPGNKAQELPHLLQLIPPFRRFYDPFVGGGAALFALRGEERYINDKSSELIALYRMVARGDRHFFQFLNTLVQQWTSISDFADANASELIELYKELRTEGIYQEDTAVERIDTLVSAHAGSIRKMIDPIIYGPGGPLFQYSMEKNLHKKMARMHMLERRKGSLSDADVLGNLESALKSAFYGYVRYLYNHPDECSVPPSAASAIFYFVREMAFASMFRYNGQNELNVPYGGMSYSRKNIARKVVGLQSTAMCEYLAKTVIENTDFEVFLRKYSPGEGDFIFLDPPYDSAFSCYGQHEFKEQDHARLAEYVCAERRARWMLVIKNTPTIQRLYRGSHLHILTVDKKYQVSFQGRNDRNAVHLVITNYG